MRLGIVIPDGVGIKNYLYTNFPDLYLENPGNSIVLFHAKELTSIVSELAEPFGKKIDLEVLPDYQESFSMRLSRESIRIGRLTFFANKLNNPTILNAAPTGGNWRRNLLLALMNFYGKKLSKKYSLILKAEKHLNEKIAALDLIHHEQLLQKNRIEALLSLHQRPLPNIPMYEAAKRLGLKRFGVIYSWDNVAKANLYTPSDKYFLWSNYMKDQMLLFYPEISEDRLLVTGTPQFSFYFNNQYKCAKEVFCKNLSLDDSKPVLLFSGSDQRTSPFDPWLLRDVAQCIQNMPEDLRPQLIFRRTPADFSERYNWVFEKYPWLRIQDPIWINKNNSWGTAIPTKKDLQNVVALMQHCDIVINVASTMALDAATYDKPCIYLSYNPKEARNIGLDVYNTTHDEDHFKVMKDINAVAYVSHENELHNTISALINNPNSLATGRKKYLQIITDNLFNDAALNLAKSINTFEK